MDDYFHNGRRLKKFLLRKNGFKVKLILIVFLWLYTLILLSQSASFDTNIKSSERKYFRYYMGLDEKGVISCKLVVRRKLNGDVNSELTKSDILDEYYRFKDVCIL